MSTCKVLELIARSGRSLSELAAGLPASTLTHQVVHCPWNRKGAVMRMLIEALKDMPTDHTDGIRVEDDGGWVQALPDPDDPVFHLYAEGRTVEESEALEAKYRLMLEDIVAHADAEPQTLN
jgi:mannose-1-phosphate guanylyltransferase/phosphomannomutase